MTSAGWPGMCDCFNRLEDSNNYSAGVLWANVAKNMSFIAGKGVKSQMLYVSQLLCLLRYDDHYIPCFLIVPPYIGLRWCPDAVIYPYIFPLLSIQSKINGSTNGEPIINVGCFHLAFQEDTIVWFFWPSTLLPPIN